MDKVITGAMLRKMVVSGTNYLEENKEYIDCFYVSELDENLNGNVGDDYVKLVDVRRQANVPKPIQFDYIKMHTYLNPNVYSKHFKSIL